MTDKLFRTFMLVGGLVAAISCILFINYLHNLPAPIVPEVTNKTFDKEVLESKIMVVVEFYADNCPNCELQAPIVEAVAKDYAGRLKFVRINAVNNPSLARQARLKDVPALLFLDPATKSGRVKPGLTDETTLRKMCEALLNPPVDNGNGPGDGAKDKGTGKDNGQGPPPAPMPPPVMPPADDND